MGNHKILIIDDEEMVNKIVQAYSAAIFPNCSVHGIVNPLEAPDLINTHRYSIIIVDMCMPQMTGDEVIKSVKWVLDEHSHIKIIPMTGGGEIGEAALTRLRLESGLDIVLRKPFTLCEFKETIKKILPTID